MVSNTPKYNVAEIFCSIQGEGYFAGKSAIFIRFTGCNLSCDFCDEPNHKLPGKELDEERILEKIGLYDPCRFIVLTGGEPTIQPNFPHLVETLQDSDYFVSVETNGTTRMDCSPDWISVSPKTEDFICGDELKIVYQNQDLKPFESLPFKHFFLQPLNHQDEINYKSVEECLALIKENPCWRLSLQIHKVLKVD